ncbi:LacI family DNA-binding transcriptional regulator [Hamadaea tsunoensis]|uniref:LacI family DNA-binding transcriptional regulator n=1 Tax=Hamadaea tsunoensis TaxID=53368 RepID=UPI00048207ED|nr:LacI family DNA-binding transcriptional regulator [Hamadaea tsunoensis]
MVDVAQLAGVSHQTVSRVLNGHPSVTGRTRVRVTAAIAELGYRRNHAARALVTGRTQVIGVIAQSSTLYGPAATLTAFAHAAVDAGFTVSVESVRALEHEPMRAAVDRQLEQRPAGLVVLAPVQSATEVLARVPPDTPMVCIDGDPEGTSDLVTVDQEGGGYTATTCLLNAGHRTVWHVAGPHGWFDSRGRLAGWRRALTDAGAEVPPVMAADWSAQSGYQAGQLLARVSDVTAVFAANDHLALGIMRALRERGLSVPGDVSIVGFDDVPEAGYYPPPLTTLRPDFDAVAVSTLELLLEQVAGRPGGNRRVIPPALVRRESVAAPTHGR